MRKSAILTLLPPIVTLFSRIQWLLHNLDKEIMTLFA